MHIAPVSTGLIPAVACKAFVSGSSEDERVAEVLHVGLYRGVFAGSFLVRVGL